MKFYIRKIKVVSYLVFVMLTIEVSMSMILDAQLRGIFLCLDGEQSLGVTKGNLLYLFFFFW